MPRRECRGRVYTSPQTHNLPVFSLSSRLHSQNLSALDLTLDNLRGNMGGDGKEKIILLRLHKHLIMPEIRELSKANSTIKKDVFQRDRVNTKVCRHEQVADVTGVNALPDGSSAVAAETAATAAGSAVDILYIMGVLPPNISNIFLFVKSTLVSVMPPAAAYQVALNLKGSMFQHCICGNLERELFLLFFLTFSVLVAKPKKLLYTMANPACGLLNREKKTKRESLAASCTEEK